MNYNSVQLEVSYVEYINIKRSITYIGAGASNTELESNSIVMGYSYVKIINTNTY